MNQERFTAGLTITGSEGIDAWARVGEDKVMLFQSKGQQKGSAVGRPGNNAVLYPGELHKYIASLMISAYASADNLVKQKISAFCKAKSKDKRAKFHKELVWICVCFCMFLCTSPFPHFTKKSPLPFTTGDPVLTRVFVFRTHHQVESIRTWRKWSKTKVMAELLLVPGTSSKTKEELPQKFRGKIIMDFKKKRCEAKAALLAELSKVTCDGISDELSDAVSKLKAALGTDAKQHVPSVLVVFRDSFDTALGDVFGGIVSRTVERPKEEEEGKSGRESDGA